jgi:hypothetical protein
MLDAASEAFFGDSRNDFAVQDQRGRCIGVIEI